jgi:hypothetical protein
MTVIKSQKFFNLLQSVIIFFFGAFALFAFRVNGFELILSGTWECKQSENISESMRGENIYTLLYSNDSSLVYQNGDIRIIDIESSLESSINYNMMFLFSNNGNVFENTLKHLEHVVTSDQLNLLAKGVAGLFPAVGETIKAELKIISENEVDSLHANGTVTKCMRMQS